MPSRVVLNSLQAEDLPEIYAIHADERLRSLRMAHRSPVSRIQAETWLSARTSSHSRDVFFAVRESQDGPCIGYVSLTDVDAPSGTAEVGIVLRLLGQGYGTDSLQQLMKIAADNLGLRRLTARVVDHNERARCLFVKCGFLEEGVLVRHYFDLGDFHDVHLFARELD